jgi:hypothetical protein
LIKKTILLYLISSETAPHYVIRNAFQEHFTVVCDYDWRRISAISGHAAMHRDFINTLSSHRPDYCFMQIQNPAAMDIPAICEIAKYTKIIHWSGDVRNTAEWYNWMAAIGNEVYLTLLCNETDVEIMRKRDIRADYLQIGFDHIYYQRRTLIKGWPDIVFVANAYDLFELSEYRTETVLAMYKAFPGQFRVFGDGWKKFGITTEKIDNGLEAECYNSCKIALSISNFNYSRYYSDRLLRIMGSGGFALSHDFPGLEKDFTPGYDIVTFSDHEDLFEKCRYYLANDHERNAIAANALLTAHSKCTWDIRCRELDVLLNHYG